MKTERTYRQIIAIDRAISSYFQRMGQDTQLGIILKHFARKQLQQLRESYEELLYINSVRFAFKDEKGVLVKDERGQLCYTVDGELDRVKANKELLNELVEIDTRFLPEKPTGLTQDEEDAFAGIFYESEE